MYWSVSANSLAIPGASALIKARSSSQRPWTYGPIVAVSFSTSHAPGKPTDNAFIDSLNGKFRAECLNAHWFMTLDEMCRICEEWHRDYHEVRPHSAIGNKAPITLMNSSGQHGPV